MGNLGHSLRFFFAASEYAGADQPQFLYDMAWYELDGRGYQLGQPMVMECEWRTGSTAEADDDFQKLVQARADLRVWVAVSENALDISWHIASCEEQIRLFRRT